MIDRVPREPGVGPAARAASRRRACGGPRIVSPSCRTSPRTERRSRAAPQRRDAASVSARRPCSSSPPSSRGSACSAAPAASRRRVAAVPRLGAQPVRRRPRRSPATPDDPTRPGRDRDRPADRQPRPPSPRRRRDRRSPRRADRTARPRRSRPRGRHDRVGPRASALQRRLDALRAKTASPASRSRCCGTTDGRGLGATGSADVAHGCRVRRDRLRVRLGLQDLHGGGRAAARRRGQGRARRARRAATCPRTASTGGSRSGCSWTTAATCTDFFFNPKIDKALQSERGCDVDARAHMALRAEGPHPSRARSATTRTRTTCCWASS